MKQANFLNNHPPKKRKKKKTTKTSLFFILHKRPNKPNFPNTYPYLPTCYTSQFSKQSPIYQKASQAQFPKQSLTPQKVHATQANFQNNHLYNKRSHKPNFLNNHLLHKKRRSYKPSFLNSHPPTKKNYKSFTTSILHKRPHKTQTPKQLVIKPQDSSSKPHKTTILQRSQAFKFQDSKSMSLKIARASSSNKTNPWASPTSTAHKDI